MVTAKLRFVVHTSVVERDEADAQHDSKNGIDDLRRDRVNSVALFLRNFRLFWRDDPRSLCCRGTGDHPYFIHSLPQR